MGSAERRSLRTAKEGCAATDSTAVTSTEVNRSRCPDLGLPAGGLNNGASPGKCRVKEGGGHAGHNGLRSIHGHLGDAYRRVRLGIGHPGHKDAVADYVLHDFAKSDQGWLDDLLRGISEGAAFLAEGEAARFMTAVALRTVPPRAVVPHKALPPVQGSPITHPQRGPEPPDQRTIQADPRSPLQKLRDRFR